MILLLGFAFLAGIVTILSPCILPILPIILSSSIGGKESGKARPIGVVTGFILSFTFFTLFLSTIVSIIGISADTLRLFSVIIIASFGISFLIPKFQIFLENLFSKLSAFIPVGNTKSGFGPGLVVGFSLGLLWTPCVGPILASVISLAITGSVTFDAFLITLAYSIGTAIPMFIIMIGGANVLRKNSWLLSNSAKIQKIFGVIMILTAFAIFFNLDRKFQTFILNTFPNYGTGLTQFEDVKEVKNELDKLFDKNASTEDMGKPMFDLINQKGIPAPELRMNGTAFNHNFFYPERKTAVTLKELRGKVVVVDFWTYSCINCQRTIPYLKKWHETYKDKGLVIIGVHSPEFEFEKNASNVQKAISDFGIEYPVIQDNNFETWRAYNNRYWPAKYFIDKNGFVRYTHFGEGAYDESEKVIQELLKETGVEVSGEVNNPSYQVYSQTRETYLGFARIENFLSNEQIAQNTLSAYTNPSILSDNTFAFSGNWQVMEEYANPKKGAKLYFNFEAKEVFLVMKNTGTTAKVKVFIDDKLQFFGEDNKDGIVTVDSDKLYKLINLPFPGRHILKLEFEDNNAQLFAFTFG